MEKKKIWTHDFLCPEYPGTEVKRSVDLSEMSDKLVKEQWIDRWKKWVREKARDAPTFR
jgi:hypothetical protein